jgi:hypothetical protein
MPRLLLRLVLLLPLVVAACATEPPLDVRLQPLVGKTEAELVQTLGVPSATYAVGGDRFLQYEDQTSTIYPGDPFWGGRYRRFGGPIYSPPLVVTRTCAITFALAGSRGDQRVASFTFRGNGCR